MSTSEFNEMAIRRLVDLYNEQAIDWVSSCYAENFEWTELPLPNSPAGRRGGRDLFQKVADEVLPGFPDRHMDILNIVSRDDQVVLEVDWHGTAALNMGMLKAGSKINIRIASFFKLLNGKIIKQTDYGVLIGVE